MKNLIKSTVMAALLATSISAFASQAYYENTVEKFSTHFSTKTMTTEFTKKDKKMIQKMCKAVFKELKTQGVAATLNIKDSNCVVVKPALNSISSINTIASELNETGAKLVFSGEYFAKNIFSAGLYTEKLMLLSHKTIIDPMKARSVYNYEMSQVSMSSKIPSSNSCQVKGNQFDTKNRDCRELSSEQATNLINNLDLDSAIKLHNKTNLVGVNEKGSYVIEVPVVAEGTDQSKVKEYLESLKSSL